MRSTRSPRPGSPPARWQPRWRTGWSTVLWLGAAACRPAGPSDPPEPPPTLEPAPREAEPGVQDPPSCGPKGEGFDAHAWAPETAPAVASIHLDDPELQPALSALGAHVRGSGHGLPIPLAFSLGQWSWQIPTLVGTLRQAGFHPRELVFVAGDDGDHAWVWRSTCDLDQAVEHIEAAWSVRARRTVEGMVATPRTTTAPPFPYDVLMLPGQRMALVPAGRATAVLDRFARPAPRLGLGVATVPTAGRRLDELDTAPVRLVFVGRALLDPAAGSAAHEPRLMRVTAQGVQPRPKDEASNDPPAAARDASLPAPPP